MPIITFVDHTIPVAADFNDSYSFINTEVRTYERGGTGLSSYTKGDILYASATNTVAKLAIGVYGQTLAVASSGIPTWTTRALFKSGTDATSTGVEADIIPAFAIAANTFGTANRLRLRLHGVVTNNSGGNGNFTLRVYYGSTTFIALTDVVGTGLTNVNYPFDIDLFGNDSASAQFGVVRLLAGTTTFFLSSGWTAAENSATQLNLRVTAAISSVSSSYTMKYGMLELIL